MASTFKAYGSQVPNASARSQVPDPRCPIIRNKMLEEPLVRVEPRPPAYCSHDQPTVSGGLVQSAHGAFRSQAPDLKCQIPGASQIPVARSQVPDPRCQIPGARSLVSDPSCQIPGAKSQVPDPKCQIKPYWLLLTPPSMCGLYFPPQPIRLILTPPTYSAYT